MGTNESPYSETQHFRQWWLWITVLTGPAIFFWAMFQQIVMDAPFGNNPAPDYVLVLLGIVVGGGLPLFMYSLRFDTEVRGCGLYIRFRPFHRNWIMFRCADIQAVEARTYNPLRDYGGWGIRDGKKGKAYNVSGNSEVLLTLRNGQNILMGSTKYQILNSAISEELTRDR